MNSPQFQTEIIAHQHVLLDAAESSELSANAVEAHDLTGVSVPLASVRWPSFFCDDIGYILVLAYLLQNNLPFDLEVAPDGPYGARYKIHPPLDDHTQRLLRSIDPRREAELAELQARVKRVFERLYVSALSTDSGHDPD